MTTLTLDLDDTDYAALEESAQAAGLSVPTFLKRMIHGQAGALKNGPQASTRPNRWARISSHIRQDAPLTGVSHIVRNHSRTLREDFALIPDDVEDP